MKREKPKLNITLNFRSNDDTLIEKFNMIKKKLQSQTRRTVPNTWVLERCIIDTFDMMIASEKKNNILE